MKFDHLRALSILAGSPNGCTEATMIGHGVTVDDMIEMIKAGLAAVTVERMIIGRKPIDVTWVRIAEAGRRLCRGGFPGVFLRPDG